MKIVSQIADLEHPNVRIGFVPTMGAFHDGHLQLMRQARLENDLVVASLFVNPTQFGKGEDFDKYPRDLNRDAELAQSAGVDVLFTPSTEEIYPRTPTTIHVPSVTKLWEGAARPGHFEGVATVVAKLFNIVRPTTAYFGLKDLQQCMVIERMVEDLNMPLSISLQPTVREPDGLAMSSRNAYLSELERAVAPTLYREISGVRDGILKGKSPEISLQDARNTIVEAGFHLDYLEWISLPDMTPATGLSGDMAIIVAAKVGTTRLIDNIRFSD